MGYQAGIRQTRADAAREAAQVAEYAAYGSRAGARMAEHELYEGSETPRTDAAARSIGHANVLGAGAPMRVAYVAAFAEGYAARFAAERGDR